ncbi:MAG: hypothetical protein KC589_06085 [Nanoarchaeota archaeon]|nr:hypothetical protein [Nanoarchaeota archaeon]
MNTNETIYLKNSIIIRKIVKKTKSEFFKTVMVGDILDLSTPVLYKGRGRSGIYATNVLVINRTNGVQVYKSLSELSFLLNNNFIYEEYIQNDETDQIFGDAEVKPAE